jgi:hypothetical protein
VDAWPDAYSVGNANQLRFDAEPPFSTPDTTRETKSRRTVNGNPGGQ